MTLVMFIIIVTKVCFFNYKLYEKKIKHGKKSIKNKAIDSRKERGIGKNILERCDVERVRATSTESISIVYVCFFFKRKEEKTQIS